MQKPPTDPKEKFLNKPMLTKLFLGALSLFVAVTVTFLFAYYTTQSIPYARTVAFATWMFGHIFLALNFRSDHEPLIKAGLLSNKVMLLWGLVVVVTLLLGNELKEKAYFEDVYKELEGIKMRIFILREELSRTYGKDSPMLLAHDRHLVELAEYVDWKLQVLEKGTSFDWKTAKGNKKDIQSDVSVQPPENITGTDFSGGYLGG